MDSEPTLTDFGNGSDPFSTGDIFADREKVRVGYIPRRDKIISREKEIDFIGSALGPAINGGPPQNVTINGKTGTGKTLVTRYMSEVAEQRAAENGVNLIHVYEECTDISTDTESIRKIANDVKDRLDAERSIPPTGISKDQYLQRLWGMLDDHDVDSLIIILDEIDKLDSGEEEDDDDQLLHSLSRAEERQETDAYVGIVCVSNDIEWRDNIDARVDSSLSDEKEVFHPYNPNQIQKILNARTEAFKDGALAEDVIPKIAALAAQEHGDARKAVDMLRYAGRIAERQGDDRVEVSHLDDARMKAEADQFSELVGGSAPHAKYVLRALALVTRNDQYDSDPKTGGYSKDEIYKKYKRVCEHECVEPRKWDTVSRLLKEQSTLGVTESHYTGGGYGEGSYRTHQLNRDPEIVLKALD